MSGYRVLLVDDEQEFTSTLEERMEARGLKADSVGSGEEALERIKNKTYDAIVLDLAMPGLDGIETLKQIKQVNPELQVILLTGQATVQKGIEAIKLGAVDLLEKPADFQELLTKIEEASAKKAILVEQRIEDQLKNILGKKSW